VPHEIRDQVVDFTVQWSDKTEIPVCHIASRVGISSSKFYNWKKRYGRVNEHNAWIPRDTWLEDGEKRAIIDYYWKNPDEGYRRLTYTMLDDDVVAVSASSVYRMLKGAGFLRRWRGSLSGRGHLCPAGSQVGGGPPTRESQPAASAVPGSSQTSGSEAHRRRGWNGWIPTNSNKVFLHFTVKQDILILRTALRPRDQGGRPVSLGRNGYRYSCSETHCWHSSGSAWG